MPIQKRFWYTSFAILLLIFIFSTRLPAQSSRIAGEYQLKASFLYNLAQFVEWPEAAFASSQDVLVIGLLGTGTDSLFNALQALIAGEKVQGRPLQVARYERLSAIEGPHILFVGNYRKERLRLIMKRLSTAQHMLTVSEAASFIQQGGMIRFWTDNHQIKLQINPEQVRTAQLNINAKLLKLSEIVSPVNSK